jgi:hypothetical protein
MKSMNIEQIAQLLAGTAKAMAMVIEALTEGNVKARVAAQAYIRGTRKNGEEPLEALPARLVDVALTPPVLRERTLEQEARHALASACRQQDNGKGQD